MSKKYSWSSMDGGTIYSRTNHGSEYLLGDQIAERMNKMQDVIDSGLGVDDESTLDDSGGIVVPFKAYRRFQNALKALTPKTIEQLATEQMQAADYMHKRATDGSDESYLADAAKKYEAAKAAYQKAAGEL